MKKPTVEDGYTRIANELFEAIITAPLSKREYKIVLTVIRKTYGFGKKEDDMTLTQIAKMTDLDAGNISKAITALVTKKVLSKQQGHYGHVIGINKKYSEWTILTKTQIGLLKQQEGCQNDKEGLLKQQLRVVKTTRTKETTKRKIKTSCRRKFVDEDLTAAKYIFSKILDLNPQHKKPNFEDWAETIRLMRERDDRTHREICELFVWANNDPFWKTNILSPKKLREQWDQLVLKRANGNGKSNQNIGTSAADRAAFQSAIDQEIITRELG